MKQKSFSLLAVLFFLSVCIAPSARAQTVNKPSIQINLRTHQQYYRGAQVDQDTWSWTPRIVYRVNGPISAGSQLSVEFTLPSGKSWIKLDCNTKETGAGSWWETECGMNSNDVKDQDASIETGLAGWKINLKNELEGTNTTLSTGKFKVEKFHVGVVDLPKFKNNFSYYVNYDWNLPIGYIYGADTMDHRPRLSAVADRSPIELRNLVQRRSEAYRLRQIRRLSLLPGQAGGRQRGRR